MSSPIQSKFFITGSRPQGSLGRLAKFGFAYLFRAVVCRVADPIIRYNFDGRTIYLPLSHELPATRIAFPHYSTNLTRAVAALAEKYPDPPVVDIGANIGDSVVLIRGAANSPVLCVEGSPRFAALCRRNIAGLSGVYLAECFVGRPHAGESLVYSKTSKGSGHVMAKAEGTTPQATVELKSLDTILAEHPEFPQPRLIKIDTDGNDLRIVHDHLDYFREHHTTIFMEYDPTLFSKTGARGQEAFEELRGLGYVRALFWDSWGDYVVTAELTDNRLLDDLDAYYRGRRLNRYADVCVFHQDNVEVADRLRAMELEFFRRFREEAV